MGDRKRKNSRREPNFHFKVYQLVAKHNNNKNNNEQNCKHEIKRNN